MKATGAIVLTVSVDVPFPPVIDAELRLQVGGTAVTGAIAQPKFTVELKPPEGAIVTVVVAELPAEMVAGANGVAAIEKEGVGVGAAVTVRLAAVVWARDPKLPVMVKSKFPVGVDALVVTVRGVLTCVPVPGTEIATGEHAEAEGSPEHVRYTVPLNPGCGFRYTMYEAEFPPVID